MSRALLFPRRRWSSAVYLKSAITVGSKASIKRTLILIDSLSFVLPFPMRAFFRDLFRSFRKPSYPPSHSFSEYPRMSSSATAAALYAATISTSQMTGAVPEEAKEKKHHLKDGKGFTNPWDSWTEMSGPTIMKALMWYIKKPIPYPLANALEATHLRHQPQPRYNTSNRHSPETSLPPHPRNTHPPRNMARPRLLLCRISRRPPRPLRPRIQRAMQPVQLAWPQALHRGSVSNRRYTDN